jgi:hypothetical protein
MKVKENTTFIHHQGVGTPWNIHFRLLDAFIRTVSPFPSYLGWGREWES